MDTPTASELMDLQHVLAGARKQAGVGELSDEEVLEPLDRILTELRIGTAALSAQGTHLMHANLVAGLATRMRIRDKIQRFPEIRDEKITAPVFITGLPRTGSTKLQRVLAATQRFQSIPLWKILNPLPIAATDDGQEDPRIEVARQNVEQIKAAFPRFYAGHPMVATEPDEESLFLEMAFKADPPCWRARLPEYMRWYMEQRIDSTYRWLKEVLQLLQWQDERRSTQSPARPWVLKAPHHLGRIDELLTVFPDATVIHCHRDPLSSIPSAAALAESMWAFCSDQPASKEAGRFVMTLLGRDIDHCLRAREHWQAAGKIFIDLHFSAIVSNAETTVAGIFAKLGVPFDDAARAGIARWEAENPPYKHGDFKYSLEQYGLSADEIRTRFAAYISRHPDAG